MCHVVHGLLWSPFTVLSQLANDHLLLLTQSYGTVFHMTLHLLHHWQCFGENWRHIYFGSRFRTLLCSLFVAVLAMVLLAVIYFGHLKNCYLMQCNVISNLLKAHTSTYFTYTVYWTSFMWCCCVWQKRLNFF